MIRTIHRVAILSAAAGSLILVGGCQLDLRSDQAKAAAAAKDTEPSNSKAMAKQKESSNAILPTGLNSYEKKMIQDYQEESEASAAARHKQVFGF